MQDSFISGDVSLKKYSKLKLQMKSIVQDIEGASGYPTKTPEMKNKQKNAKQSNCKSTSSHFKVMNKQFEDLFKPIEDPVIKQWMQKLEDEYLQKFVSTVSMSFISDYLQKISEDFNQMMQFSKLPIDTFNEEAKMNNFEKSLSLKQIEDDLINVGLLSVLIYQGTNIYEKSSNLSEDSLNLLKKQMEMYGEMATKYSSGIIDKISQLLISDTMEVFNKNSKQILLLKLNNVGVSIANQWKDGSSILESNQVSIQKPANNQLKETTSTKKNPEFSIQVSKQKENWQYQSDVQDYVIQSNNNREIHQQEGKETNQRDKLSGIIKRILKSGKSIVKCSEVRDLIKFLSEYKEMGSVLHLMKLTDTKGRLQEYIQNYQIKQENGHNLFDNSILKKDSFSIGARLAYLKDKVIRVFKLIEDKSYLSIHQEEFKKYRRYLGDNGMITHRHFLLNKDNIIPLLKELDPIRFPDEGQEQKVNLVKKQKEMMQRHIERLQKSKLSTSTISSNTRGRSESRANSSQFEMSQIFLKRGESVILTKKQNKDEINNSNNKHTLEDYQNLLGMNLNIDQKNNNNNIPSSPQKNTSHSKCNKDQFSISIARKRGLSEFVGQKNSSNLLQNLQNQIFKNFDADKINEIITKQDEEQRFILDSSNRMQDIQQKRASQLQRMSQFQQQQQVRQSKSDVNSMAEQSQENLSSSENSSSDSYEDGFSETYVFQSPNKKKGALSTAQKTPSKYSGSKLLGISSSEDNDINLSFAEHRLERTEATQELNSFQDKSPYVKKKFIIKQRTISEKRQKTDNTQTEDRRAFTDSKQKGSKKINTSSSVVMDSELIRNEDSFSNEFLKTALKKNRSISYSDEQTPRQIQLKNRQAIMDKINAQIMPKYIHEFSSKLITKTNPQMLRNLLQNFTKKDYENKAIKQDNESKKNQNNCYGIEQLSQRPTGHNFYTSSLQSTYDDIKTTRILQNSKLFEK